ncbi:MAG: hypothetical protein AMDU5_GPLC00013G0002 [Thermoplasmatales archaeon Gpl]|nr:MAG: hypothetical protein AMDU5_GPLC00013G0002 [Thermoplasmatales archaeon Gpl]
MPLLAHAPIIALIFYAILGFLFRGYAGKKTYWAVIGTQQMMGSRYGSIYEMILIGTGVSALGTGLLVAVGAVPLVDTYAFLPGAGWFTLPGSFIFGFGMMLGIIPGSVAGYFAYIFLNTKLAGSKTGVHYPAKVISRYNSLLEQYAFSIISGLILVTIGMESLSVNSKYLIKIPDGLMAQESEVMIIAGFVVMILSLAISTYRYARAGEIKKPTIVPTTR